MAASETEPQHEQAFVPPLQDPPESVGADGTSARRSDSDLAIELAKQYVEESRIRTHYYVKVGVSAFLCALLLIIGVPVFMESRVTGSLAYTALGVVLVGFGLILAVAVIVLLFRPPFVKR